MIRFPMRWWSSLRTGRQVGAPTFLLGFALANAALFQWPLYLLAASTRTAFDGSSVLALATLFVLQLVISVTVLGVAALVSIRLLKGLCAFFTVGNAIALYFIVQYRIVIDATMIGNVFNTNVHEASELAHPKLLLYVMLLGVLPAWALVRMRVARTPRWCSGRASCMRTRRAGCGSTRTPSTSAAWCCPGPT